MKYELSESQMKTIKGGLLPFHVVLFIDAALIGFMSGYIYESYTSDH